MPNARNSIEYEGFFLEQLNHSYFPTTFNCGNSDLNEFFTKDARAHDSQLLTKTYGLVPVGTSVLNGCTPAGYVSFANDVINQELVEEVASKNFWKRFRKTLPAPKRYRAFPAVKIVRLGVQKTDKRHGAGTAIINITKKLFVTKNRTGCRYITVDAYITEEAIAFYSKNEFMFFGSREEERVRALLDTQEKMPDNPETTPMYFDLSRLSNLTD